MTHKNNLEDEKPIIGITIGDPNGIGPEIILKSLAHNHILRLCTPVIYGSMKVLSKYRKLLNLDEWAIQQINSIEQINPKKTNLINTIGNKNIEIQPGTSTSEAGELAYSSILQAAKDLQTGHLHALVTAPINKNNIQNENFDFVGHTEFFAHFFQSKTLMLLVAETLKVGLITTHLPLRHVAQHITADRLNEKIQILQKSLKQDFNIPKPKIAILGLNPHAGEEGLLGDEEQKTIRPVIIELKKKGILVFGPFPADGFFGSGEYKKYDAILAMYHDQGLVPFKTLAFDSGVNFTAGLPIIRTSPDHGTAYNIAGKGIADHTAMLEAIFKAIDIVKNRQETLKNA
ncbi:MAG: 4-hydroxythreonine-4-phosphate dehydrogenase PdxA [Cytophagales bacterium]|nr:MAG: 4-hydroxythreonine-4-phosphate dehydrogenase PdxA [Cytophagales bacterium]